MVREKELSMQGGEVTHCCSSGTGAVQTGRVEGKHLRTDLVANTGISFEGNRRVRFVWRLRNPGVFVGSGAELIRGSSKKGRFLRGFNSRCAARGGCGGEATAEAGMARNVTGRCRG